jgi:hypothetical protein
VSEQSATDAARDIIFADSKNRARGELIRTIIEAPDGADIVVIVQPAPGALISLGITARTPWHRVSEMVVRLQRMVDREL